MAKLGNAAGLAAVDAVAALCNGGHLRIYAGTVPADADDPPGTLLAELNMSNPAFQAAAMAGAEAVAQAHAIAADSSADASGTATYFRLYKSDGTTVVAQGTVSATGGGGELQLGTTSITAGLQVAVTSLSIRMPTA